MFKSTKRIIAFCFAVIMVVSMVGCGDSSTNNSGQGGTNDAMSGTNLINDGVDVSQYKGSEVIFATWRDPKLNEDKDVVEDFEKKYGITVKTDLISEGSYTQTVLGRIASNNAPDVFFCTYTFPACLNALQPIDAAKLNLEEKIWDQSLIEATTINGKTYLVNTVSNIWNDFDMVFYNKKIFKQNNITTPDTYIENGKWTFDALKKCLKDVAALGGNYKGGILNYEGIVNSTGESFIKLENGKFVNGYSDKLVDVVKWMSTGIKDGYISGIDAPNAQVEFKKGNVGLIVSFSWALKKTGGLNGMNPDDIGFATLPSWDEETEAVPTTFVRGWGICRGAANPVAAGIFLRYYLDVDNYDTTTAFINKEAADFFFKTTSNMTNINRYYVFGDGVGSVTQTFNDVYYAPSQDPSQVETFLKGRQNQYNEGIDTLNSLLDSIK